MGTTKHIYFDIKFKMKVVNDKLVYIDESDKKKGYNLNMVEISTKQDWSMRLLQKQVEFGQKKAMNKSEDIRDKSNSLFYSSQSL